MDLKWINISYTLCPSSLDLVRHAIQNLIKVYFTCPTGLCNSFVLENFIRAYWYQIALEIMLLPILTWYGADVSQIVCGRKFFLEWGSLNSDAADVKRTQDPRGTHLEVRGNDTETAEVVRHHE